MANKLRLYTMDIEISPTGGGHLEELEVVDVFLTTCILLLPHYFWMRDIELSAKVF
jgi:hypothetical protein